MTNSFDRARQNKSQTACQIKAKVMPNGGLRSGQGETAC